MDDHREVLAPYCGICERPWIGHHFIEPPEGEYRVFVLVGRDDDCPTEELGVTRELAQHVLHGFVDEESLSKLWDAYEQKHYPRRAILDRLAG